MTQWGVLAGLADGNAIGVVAPAFGSQKPPADRQRQDAEAENQADNQPAAFAWIDRDEP